PADEGVQRIPVGAAQRRQRGAGARRVLLLGGDDEAPVRRPEPVAAGIGVVGGHGGIVKGDRGFRARRTEDQPGADLLARLFRLRAHGATARTELLGGATTFVTMAYIIVVNPAILEVAELPRGPSTVATILAAVFGSLLMGLYANRPIAVAPYMGENAFI